MKFLGVLLPVVMLLPVIYSVTAIRRAKRQISEMLDALADIKNGNGNRRILARYNEIAAPLAFEINDIILSYENKLSAFRQTEETARQLMTSLSHDVRTPLTTLIGYLDAVHKGVVTGGDRDEYIEIARQKSHALKDYIDILFDWFKLRSDEFVIQTDSVETAELTRNILIDWIPVFEDKQIAYDLSIPEQPLWAELDPDGYRRVLHNLIQNVITHSRADQIRISLRQSEDLIEVQVSDNGTGIEETDLKHIFERLYNCDKEYSDKSSGLGLSIAYQLMKKMNGEIAAESEPDKGAVFTLTFPYSHTQG